MKKGRLWLAGCCLLLGGGMLRAEGNLVKLDAEQRSHLDILTATPEPVSSVPLAQAPGRVVLPPAREFAVTAVQQGIITRVNVPLGVKVTKGQVLAEIDSVGLVDLQRAVVEANTLFGLAESKLRRDETLLREGIISQLRWQETKSDFDRAQASLRASEQVLMSSGIARSDVERIKSGQGISGVYPVLSPIDGMVLERMAIVGQRVEAFSPLFRIGKLDELWIEVDMPQERIREIRIGDRVTVNDPKARARIIEVSQNVDPRSQSTIVRALVESGKEQLRPGMNLNVQTLHRSTDRLFKVPTNSIFSHGGRNYVFVRRKTGFEAVPVAVAGQDAYTTTLHGGLNGGEAIVVQGIAGLKAAWIAVSEGVSPAD